MPVPFETVAEFDTVTKAELACRALLAAGIRAEIADASPGGMGWDAAAHFGLFAVRVPPSDADRAVTVLEDEFGEDGAGLDDLQDEIDG